MVSMKKYILRIIEGNNPDTTFEIYEGVTYEIRRSLPGGIPPGINRRNTIFINDPEISKLHATIAIVAGELIIADKKSTNGIFVNNRKTRKSLVLPNDLVKIGTTVIQVLAGDKARELDRTFIGPGARYSKPTHDFKKMAKISEEDPVFNPVIDPENLFPREKGHTEEINNLFLKIHNLIENIPRKETEEPSEKPVKGYMFNVNILDGKSAGTKRTFFKKSITIGRTGDLFLSDESISREHTKVTVSGNGLYKAQDLGTQNGTFINNVKIHTATFKKGDTLKVGNVSLSFSDHYEEF
jgi:pSer/pThr/pTyr-binding forkhead associated (FHA) protein